MNDVIQTKRCPKCEMVLPLSDFYRDKQTKDGLSCWCKACIKAKNAQYYQSNNDAILKQQAEYRQANKDAIAQKQAQHYQSNKEAIAQKKAEWYQENKEAIAQKQAEYYQENKDAIAQKKAEWYQENKDAIAQKKAEWYQENKEAIAQKQAEYYQENKDAILQKQAEWYKANKDKIAKYNAEYYNPQTHPLNWAKIMVNGYRKMDRDRGFDDSKTISAEWFLQHIAYRPCVHCGVQGIGNVGCNRLDNTKGHTIDNVEPCCLKCNCKENIRDQLARGIHTSQIMKKQSFKTFVNEHKAKNKKD